MKRRNDYYLKTLTAKLTAKLAAKDIMGTATNVKISGDNPYEGTYTYKTSFSCTNKDKTVSVELFYSDNFGELCLLNQTIPFGEGDIIGLEKVEAKISSFFVKKEEVCVAAPVETDTTATVPACEGGRRRRGKFRTDSRKK